MRLKDKVAVVTGASAGMGRAIASKFAEEGAKVIAAARSESLLQELAEESKKFQGEIVPVVADVTKLEDIDRMIEVAENQFGKLDILCNVAGINDLCYPLDETSDERWDNVINLDLKSPFQICRKAIKGMVERGEGVILNIGSYAGIRGNHGPSYSAAKHGLIGLTQSIAVGFANKGIRCNIINPGGINTNIGLHSGGQYHPEGISLLRSVIGKFPIKQMGDPEDIANTALFLCSDESKHINGAVISVDGGMSAC